MKSSKKFLFPKSRKLDPKKLKEIYLKLKDTFGHRKWWPGDTPFEIIIGAILTQNTSWTNVELAIKNLKNAGKLTPKAIYAMPVKELAALIRPAGYFNVKADRLRHFLEFLFKEYGGDLDQMFREDGEVLRKKFLTVKGVGPETADSILLYAGNKPFFVIDAYTKRIFSRHRILMKHKKGYYHHARLFELDYHDWQRLFMQVLPPDLDLYNDFHAQIVYIAKDFCRSSKVYCETCPLRSYL